MIKNLEVFLNRNTVNRFKLYYRTGRIIKILFWSLSILHTWEPVSTVYLRTTDIKEAIEVDRCRRVLPIRYYGHRALGLLRNGREIKNKK
jgi:hypothetical protein